MYVFLAKGKQNNQILKSYYALEKVFQKYVSR